MILSVQHTGAPDATYCTAMGPGAAFAPSPVWLPQGWLEQPLGHPCSPSADSGCNTLEKYGRKAAGPSRRPHVHRDSGAVSTMICKMKLPTRIGNLVLSKYIF